MKWKIPLYKVLNDSQEVKAVSKVIKRGMDWAIGPEIENFENELAKYVGSKYCISFNSGTSAGHAALLALKIKKNSEVIVPSFSFISTANWPLMVNTKPKFADIEYDSFGMEPNDLRIKFSVKTKAVIPVHYAGLPCKINEILDFTKKKKIPLIEDAAESLGSTVRKKKVGTFGDMGIFSFAGNKVLTCGEGGAVVTNSKKLSDRLELIRSHGRLTNNNYFRTNEKPTYIQLGYNWRMSSITAALASSQLTKIEKLIKMRRSNAKYMTKQLDKYDEIYVLNEGKEQRHVFQLFSILLSTNKLRSKLFNFLTKKQIMTKIFFEPIHKSKFYKNSRNLKLINTNDISSRIISLPMYPQLTKNEMNYICNSIEEFLERESCY